MEPLSFWVLWLQNAGWLLQTFSLEINTVITLGGVLLTAGALIQRINNLETRFHEKFDEMKERRCEDLEHIDSELARIERNAAQENERVRVSVGQVRSLIEKLVVDQREHRARRD